MVNNDTALTKADALKKITEHARDYLSLTLTIPLGNPALKKVHTNQFLFCDLPEEFELANWSYIADALNSGDTRFGKYVKGRWYIEGNDISVDVSGKGEMKLTLNAFPSTLNNYTNNYRDMQKAYNDATKKTTTTTSNNKNKSNAIKNNNSSIKNGWWGTFITNLVKKYVGNESDVLKKCKKMQEVFRQHIYYSYYFNMQKTSGSVNKIESAWKNAHLNCGDGANILSAIHSCCGAKTGIYLTYDAAHYIVKVEIAGKTYWVDQAGATGAHDSRGWNQTWHGYRSGNYKGRYV